MGINERTIHHSFVVGWGEVDKLEGIHYFMKERNEILILLISPFGVLCLII